MPHAAAQCALSLHHLRSRQPHGLALFGHVRRVVRFLLQLRDRQVPEEWVLGYIQFGVLILLQLRVW